MAPHARARELTRAHARRAPATPHARRPSLCQIPFEDKLDALLSWCEERDKNSPGQRLKQADVATSWKVEWQIGVHVSFYLMGKINPPDDALRARMDAAVARSGYGTC